MICENCKKERPEKDFYLRKKNCYQCEYKRKTGKKDPLPKCPSCGKNARFEIYCSEKCEEAGEFAKMY